MRTVRPEPCIRKANRETIQRQRGTAQTGPGDTGEGGEGRPRLSNAPQPGSEEGHLGPRFLEQGALLPVRLVRCDTAQGFPCAVDAAHRGFALSRHPHGTGLRSYSALGDRHRDRGDRPHHARGRNMPGKVRIPCANARRPDPSGRRPRCKGLSVQQPAAAWRRRGTARRKAAKGLSASLICDCLQNARKSRCVDGPARHK